ncbi:MAG: homoaconitate hydratase [Acidobacteria bacterium]|nr:homoaconitate hydratase [Acidobacteriota bacterium]
MAHIDPASLWTGHINARTNPGGFPPRVGLYDTTLRDGEQTVGVVLAPEQKLEIARMLDRLGVDRIEAGFPRVSEDDRRAVELVAGAGLRAEVWGFSRALVDDVSAVVELGLGATVIEAPVSDLKMGALGVTREIVLKRIHDAVSFAHRQGVRVAFFGVDGSRADPGFLERAYRTAIDAGAEECVVVDTLGIASPESAAYLVGQVRSWVGPAVPLHFHGHNDFGVATAAALAAVRAGASWVHGTIDGMGERAGNADLGQVALTLDALYGVETGLDLRQLRGVSSAVRAMAGYSLEPWRALVGDNLFVRETGAVAAQFHVPEAIEPYASSLLDTPRRIVLGKKSGVASIRLKCEELGLDVPEASHATLLAAVKEQATRTRRLVPDEDFRAMVARVR